MNSDKIYKVMIDLLLHLHVCGICILADDNLNRLGGTHYNNISSAHTTGRYYIGRKDKKALVERASLYSERMKRHSRRVCS
jgi:hypothetical protein